jgi:hypothetical protein
MVKLLDAGAFDTEYGVPFFLKGKWHRNATNVTAPTAHLTIFVCFPLLCSNDIRQLHVARSCYPPNHTHGGETKENIEVLQPMFDVLTNLGIDATEIHSEYQPLIVTNKADMSVGWKLTKKDGACKVKKAICLYCAFYSDHVEEPVCPCGTCFQDQHHDGMVTDDNACYHYNVVDDDELEITHVRTKEIMNMLGADLDEITAQSQVCLPRAGAFDIWKNTPAASTINHPMQQVRTSIFRFLAEELDLRDMNPVERWRQRGKDYEKDWKRRES